MKITHYASACVEIEHDGVRVLCDPWLTEGIYYGSWFHYPPLTITPEDLADVDYLYISHVHPDHMDIGTLQRLPTSIPVLIHEFGEKFLRRILLSLGFERVIEVPHGQQFELAPGFNLAIFAADDCDPAVCGKHFGCAPPGMSGLTGQIDTLGVFTANNRVIVNANDCSHPLSRQVVGRIRKRFGRPDVLMVGYNNVGSYPQCFENYDRVEKRKRAEAKQDLGLRWMAGYVKQLEPRRLMPFAGQYTLGGRLGHLNRLRGMPELEELPELCKVYTPGVEPLLLNQGGTFEVDTGGRDPFVPPDPTARDWFVQSTASRPYLYDEPNGYVDLMPLLRDAYRRMRQHQEAWGYRSDWRFYFDVDDGETYMVSFDGVTPPAPHEGRLVEPYLRISLARRLLEMILTRRAHFNNADIGSHLMFHRKPDIHDRLPYRMACYLQA